MRRRFWPGGTIIVAILVLIGIGTAITAAATGSDTAPAGKDSAVTVGVAGHKCATVYKITTPTSNPVGNLCADVIGAGTTIGQVTITFTATSNCSGSVVLRASGIDQSGTEFDKVSTVPCGTTPAVASFRQVAKIRPGSEICGLLIAPDTYTSAQACVPIA